jgi:hypothetical protein
MLIESLNKEKTRSAFIRCGSPCLCIPRITRLRVYMESSFSMGTHQCFRGQKVSANSEIGLYQALRMPRTRKNLRVIPGTAHAPYTEESAGYTGHCACLVHGRICGLYQALRMPRTRKTLPVIPGSAHAPYTEESAGYTGHCACLVHGRICTQRTSVKSKQNKRYDNPGEHSSNISTKREAAEDVAGSAQQCTDYTQSLTEMSTTERYNVSGEQSAADT